MKYFIPFLTFILGAGLSYFLLVNFSQTEKNTEYVAKTVTRVHKPQEALSSSQTITCNYPQFLNANYTDYTINHELAKPESNPVIITFSELSEDLVTLRFIDATQTVSEVNAIKLYEDTEKITLIEGANGTYTTLHTIFLDKNLAINSKQLDVLGVAVSAGSSIGHCI